jgi:anti-anti-sigma factor
MPCGHHRAQVRHTVDADLTIYTAAEQKARLLPIFRTPYSEVELDLAHVGEIDTVGVQLLILGCKVTLAVGGALRLSGVGPNVAAMIELLGLEETLQRAQNHCPQCASERVSEYARMSDQTPSEIQ